MSFWVRLRPSMNFLLRGLLGSFVDLLGVPGLESCKIGGEMSSCTVGEGVFVEGWTVIECEEESSLSIESGLKRLLILKKIIHSKKDTDIEQYLQKFHHIETPPY